MVSMPKIPDQLVSFRERHPLVADALYQTGLCITTFSLALTIARYGPESENPGKIERICPNGAREDEVELGFLAVCLSANHSLGMMLNDV